MSTPPDYIALQVDEAGSATVTGDLGLPLTKGTFSLTTWVQYDAFSSNASIIERDGEFLFRAMDNGFFFQITGLPPAVWESSENLTDGWYNVCVSYDQGIVRIYVNGDFKQMSSVGGSNVTSSNPIVIGSGLQGLITEVVVYNVALTAVQALDAQYNDLDASLVAGYFDFSQNPPVDKGPKALSITLSGGATPVLVTPGLHVKANGYAYPMHDADINPGGQHVDPYTVQSWIYCDRSVPEQVIFANSDLNAGTGMLLKISYDSSQRRFFLVSQRGTSESDPAVTSSVQIPLSTWTNIATTFDGTVLTVYVNGTVAGNLTCGPITLSRTYSDLIIGATFSATGNGGTRNFQGFISRLEIWDIALTAAEVAQYQGSAPFPTTSGLVASYDLVSSPAQNSCNGHSIGMVEGAHLHQQIGTAPVTSGVPRVEQYMAKFETPTVSKAQLAKWRAEIDHKDFLVQHTDHLNVASAVDASQFNDKLSQDKIHTAYADVRSRLEDGVGPNMPLTFTRHEMNGRRYLVGHDRNGSYVAYDADILADDDCTIWKIQLVFVAVAGVLAALFGVRSYLSGNAQRSIRALLVNPTIAAILSQGPKITAGAIFALMGAIVTAGGMRSLIWAIVQLGFWSLLGVAARAVLVFFGVGAADIIASLAVSVVAFIATYSQRPVSCDPLPALTVAAIKFNHDPTHASVDALSIRQDALIPVDIPEWRLGHTTAAQSPAAYAIDAVTGKTVTVQAKFTIDTTDATSLQIQATGGGILGAIDATTVNFFNGVSSPEYVTLNLPSHQLAAGGIQAINAAFAWQYKQGAHAWKPAATTNHRIYTVMTQPSMPWQQSSDPLESQLPWVTALEYACTWASSKTTATEALTEVTTKINSAYGLTYDTTSGASFYTAMNPTKGNVFLLTSFLIKLGGGTGLGGKVNCTDCATFVTTFSNLVGCNIQASVMGNPSAGGFDCNQIQAIGSTSWAYPFPVGGHGRFSYHEVAWTAATGNSDYIYDACLKLDSSDNPWTWPGSGHTPVLPINFQFTSQPIPTTLPIATPFTSQTYRERLATNTANGITKCSPSGQWPKTQSGRRYVV